MTTLQLSQARAEPGNLEVDSDLMKKGLEEALKHQLNSIQESVKYCSMEMISQKIRDYQTLTRIAEEAGVNVNSYSFKFGRLMDKINMALHRQEDKK